MLSYQVLGLHSDQVNVDTDKYFSQKKIEKMKAMLKCHRAAVDFDSKFVLSTVASADFEWNTEIDQSAPDKKRKGKGIICWKQIATIKVIYYCKHALT